MAVQTELDLVRDLRHMGDYRFEEFVADVWEAMGYRVNVRAQSNDKGVDVEATHAETGEYVVIQAKCYSALNKIGRPAIQQYSSLYLQEGADNVILVLTGYYTDTAWESAQELGVDLINGADLCGILSDLEFGDQITQHYFGRSTPSQRRWGNNYFGKSTLLQTVVALLGGVYLLGVYSALTTSPLSLPIPEFLLGIMEVSAIEGTPGSGLALFAPLAMAFVLQKWAYLWRWKAAGLFIPVAGFAVLLISTLDTPKPWMLWIAVPAAVFSPIIIPAMFSFTAHWRLVNGIRRGYSWGRKRLSTDRKPTSR